MFGKTVDLGEKRDVMSAFSFYVVQLVALVGFATVMAYFLGMAGVVHDTGNFFDGSHYYTVVGSAFTLWLGGSILSKRNATNDVLSILIVAAGVYLAWTSSVMIGLIPIAVLTTIGNK